MKLRTASIVIPLLLFILAPAFAIETPRIVPRMQEIHRPEREVFATPQAVFHRFIIEQFPARQRRRAARTPSSPRLTALDDVTWRNWAYCETGPVQMIYKLEDGTVTVTVKLDKNHAAFDARKRVGGFPGHAMGSAPIRTR